MKFRDVYHDWIPAQCGNDGFNPLCHSCDCRNPVGVTVACDTLFSELRPLGIDMKDSKFEDTHDFA